MGRAIQPTAIRRTAAGAEIEVLSASGFWTKLSLLSDASRANLDVALHRAGFLPLGDPTWGEVGDFHYKLPPVEDDNKGDVPPPDQGKADKGGQSDQDDQSEGAEGQGQGGGSDQPPTVEDIIRRIAGEMDINVMAVTADALANLESEFQSKLDQFQPKLGGNGSGGEGDLFQITTRIEVKTATASKSKDGIFHKQFDKLTKLVAAGQHVYLPGPPGTGKSHAAEQVASVLDWRFASISLGPTTPESRLWGGMDAHGKFNEPPFVKLARHAQENPESGAVYCLDELDNGHSGVIATLNSAMANGWFTAPNGDVITMGKNFVIVGAANTFGTGPTAEFAGRNKLDAATLDRFCYLPWDTDLAVEKALVLQYLDAAAARAWLEVWRTCRKNVKDNGLKVFCTMRGCINGARLIAAGLDAEDVLMMVLGNKIPDDQWRKIKP